ncbi:serine/threonine-protein phosphatase 7 long form homolog [Chenopodium quinoa]|uniref:serine/threonine-protein phosphatase 7 long form homolog n=1 Tax=Chenopodium quinoa TaxID=63459 RepID=UPI000B78FE4D|nr:serine/threonine-protein phosphatase 7 long form homolog [Chenopodium quinoa]
MLGVDDTTQKPPLKGSALRLSWLRKNFSNLSPDADDLTVQRFARAYILMLMGSVLFTDKSGDVVQLIYLPLLTDLHTAGNYSWGSATLAFLYRQLCRACRREAKEIGGPLLLLQLWSWEHIHIGVPTISRLRQADNNPPEQQPEDVTDPQILGSQIMKGIDPLACSWLRVYFTRVESASGGLSYYRDALDHQSDDQIRYRFLYDFSII